MADLSRLPGPIAAIWDWQLRGACRHVDPDVFFHPEGERSRQRDARDRVARAVCASCPVITECRRHALAVREPYGVWGGLTVEDRDRLGGPARAAVTPAAVSAVTPAVAGPDSIGETVSGIDREVDTATTGR